ncbi:uncharacterized protein BYT42DRAFT_612580 [Radiomyces spectabilis]|uniref:uncharacterized protein n=1 Tax=Radiomyces spectabilis TaxID=64574 RepID=UPI00221F79C5|nr:uncharacterized protein BYT42DRAFT_612580 [Radiomyces spectabilis]KAI8384914.1 hypothetical protein BYT42DRAFT_612580 [Radiomyces spectabilis]
MDKVGKAIVYAGGIIGTGYALMKLTVPDEEQMRKRLNPKLQREADDIKASNAQKNQALMEHLREVAESDKPAWQTKSSS